MLKVIFLVGITTLLLNGCTQFIAATSGTEPVGKTEGQRTLSQRIEDMSIEKTADINLFKTDPEFKRQRAASTNCRQTNFYERFSE